jgi:hypothetical protein
VVSVSMLLDREAVQALRGQGGLSELLGAADLRADGWQVVGPVPRPPGGFVEFRADRVVSSVAEADAALARVSPVLDGLVVSRSTSPGMVRLRVSGDVDLSDGPEGIGGDDVLRRTFGAPLGAPLAEVERELGGPLADRVSLVLDVRLPNDEGRVELPVGTTTTVDVVSMERDVRSLMAAIIGVVALGFAALLTVLTVRATRRRGSVRGRP